MGSGLQDLLATVYAPNAVTQMITGKAVARAVRGHFLIDTALHAILLSRIFNMTLPEQSNTMNEVAGDHTVSDISSSEQSNHHEKDSHETEPQTTEQDSENIDHRENIALLLDAAQLYDSLTED